MKKITEALAGFTECPGGVEARASADRLPDFYGYVCGFSAILSACGDFCGLLRAFNSVPALINRRATLLKLRFIPAASDPGISPTAFKPKGGCAI